MRPRSTLTHFTFPEPRKECVSPSWSCRFIPAHFSYEVDSAYEHCQTDDCKQDVNWCRVIEITALFVIIATGACCSGICRGRSWNNVWIGTASVCQRHPYKTTILLLFDKAVATKVYSTRRLEWCQSTKITRFNSGWLMFMFRFHSLIIK